MRLLLFLAGLATGLLLAWSCSRTDSTGSRPDLLFVVLDDISASELDRIDTPTLDHLASRGTVCERMYAMPGCCPTRYGFMFGQYGFRDGIGGIISARAADAVDNHGPPLERPTLAAQLQSIGYETAMFGKWHLDNANQFGELKDFYLRRGFDEIRAGTVGNFPPRQENYFSWERLDNGEIRTETEYATTAQTEAAMEWWDRHAGQSRFAYLCYNAPHFPFQAPPEHLAAVASGADKRALYVASIEALDKELGRLIELVENGDPGLENTLIVVIGDNGTPEGATAVDQDRNKVKRSVFEDGIRVPCILAGLGLPAARSSRTLLHAVDFYATFAELTRFEFDHALVAQDSHSMVGSLWREEASAREWTFCQRFSPNGAPSNERDFDAAAVITPTHKLMRVLDQGVATWSLYDLQSDPQEQHPLPPTGPVADLLRSTLDQIQHQGG